MDTDINYRAKKLNTHRILHYTSLTSTNDVLEGLSKEGKLKDGDVVLADFQTEGRGMRGNSWDSEAEKNLLFSIYLDKLNLLAEEQFYVSKLISICLGETLKRFCSPNEVKIKWPNDILLNNKKCSGILIQLSIRNNKVQNAIAGIGLNVLQTIFPKDLMATSILKETEKTVMKETLLDSFLQNLDGLRYLLTDKNWEEIDKRYHTSLWCLNQFRTYTDHNNVFQACLRSVGRDGRAEFEFANGDKQLYAIKEISPA